MNEVFRIGAKGLEKLNPKPSLPFGSKVIHFGSGMSEAHYAVIGEPNKFGDQPVVYMGSSEYLEHSMFDSIESHASPISKKFGIGMYWDDIKNEVYNEVEVYDQIEKAKRFDQVLEERAKKAKEKDAVDVENLKKEYSYLTLITGHDKKVAKSNMICLLNRTFPEVKFSVRCEHYSTYNVSWTDGPSDSSVRKITGKFVDSHLDQTGEYMDYEPSNFNYLFGGFNHVFTNRSYSEKANAIIESTTNEIEDHRGKEIFRRELYSTDFPNGYTSFDFKLSREPQFIFEVPEQPTSSMEFECTQIGDLKIIDYSEKSFVVTGNTKPIKDTLKDLGGRFNFRLTCGAGWVFQKSKLEIVKEALQIQ